MLGRLPPLSAFLFAGAVTMTSIGVAAPALGQGLPRASPEAVGLSEERLERIGETFQRYVDDGRIAGAVGLVARQGRVAFAEAWGMRDRDAGDEQEVDDLFRIASMTKPVTSVAVMMLYEEGRFFLTDPISRFLPEFGDLSVADLEAASAGEIPTEPAARPITILDMLRHTSGLTYGSFSNTPVDAIYRERGILDEPTSESFVAAIARAPLVYQPGTQWHYSLGTDVLGRLVEVVSGRPFDVFLRERIFEPLGMDDTSFHVPDEKADRVSVIYGHSGPEGALAAGNNAGYLGPPTRPSGGGGLYSTASDYVRFAQMLLNGGELDGVRLLSPTTVALMATDHLGDMPTGFLSPGWGFGLGFTVKGESGLDGMPESPGTYLWYGVLGTGFWIDPHEDLVGVFMVQIRPNRDVNFRRLFSQLTYQSIVE